jgi:hypothetical protein
MKGVRFEYMDKENMIELKGVDLRKFVQRVYALSSPQGLGIMHFQDGGLSDADADAILERDKKGRVAASMDYVHGRACKMTVFRDEDDKLYVREMWYDHTRDDLKELLAAFGIELPAEKDQPSGWGTAA